MTHPPKWCAAISVCAQFVIIEELMIQECSTGLVMTVYDSRHLSHWPSVHGTKDHCAPRRSIPTYEEQLKNAHSFSLRERRLPRFHTDRVISKLAGSLDRSRNIQKQKEQRRQAWRIE